VYLELENWEVEASLCKKLARFHLNKQTGSGGTRLSSQLLGGIGRRISVYACPGQKTMRS
jgi:hypothetical protein